MFVVPYVGTWIEILRSSASLRGNKCRSLRGNVDRNTVPSVQIMYSPVVVPYVGTWIEILHGILSFAGVFRVVPYVGTWIEIGPCGPCSPFGPVVPYVGTWIEM